MSAPSPIASYVAEISKDDPCHLIHRFLPYSPSPVSPDVVHEALEVQDPDLASIQLAHYWLQTDRWTCHHNTEVEEQEHAWKEAEDMRKVEEKKIGDRGQSWWGRSRGSWNRGGKERGKERQGRRHWRWDCLDPGSRGQSLRRRGPVQRGPR